MNRLEGWILEKYDHRRFEVDNASREVNTRQGSSFHNLIVPEDKQEKLKTTIIRHAHKLTKRNTPILETRTPAPPFIPSEEISAVVNPMVSAIKKVSRATRELPHRLRHLEADKFFSRGIQTIVLAEKGQLIEILGANPPQGKKPEDGPTTIYFPDGSVAHCFGGAFIDIHFLGYKDGKPVPEKLIKSCSTVDAERLTEGTYKLSNGIIITENNGKPTNPKAA